MSEEVDRVVIDSREPDDVDALFEENDQVKDVQRWQLDVGDYVVRVNEDEDPIVFERKTISDFIGSMKNRRLETQVNEMYKKHDPENSFVLVEGDMQDYDFMPHSEFSSKSARGFVASLSGRWQCVPLFCSEKVHLVDMVVRVSRKCIEETDRILRDPDSTPTTADPSFYDKMLIQLDSIGRKTKEEIQKDFDSPQDFIQNADQDSLEEVKGIGSKTAESILDQIDK